MIKSKKLLLAIGLAGLVVLVWAGALIAFLVVRPSLPQWTLIITGAAVVTEIAMWMGVAVLGFTALERFRLWSRFRRK